MASSGRPSSAEKSRRLGMREIASRVGVSPITVSRALKDPSKVSPETRQRVLDAIEREGFIPNQLASSMRGPGRIIGTMVPPLINSGIAEQVQGMSDETHESGYQLLLIQGDFGAAAEEKAIRALLGWRPAGLILQAFVQSNAARGILADSVGAGGRDQRDPRQEADRHGGRHLELRDRLRDDRPSRQQGLQEDRLRLDADPRQ